MKSIHIHIRATPEEAKMLRRLAKKLKQTATKTIWQAIKLLSR